jgi:transketolase
MLCSTWQGSRRLIDIRPCDANEVAEAWRFIMEMKHEPAALILSRQALPTLDRSKFAPASGLRRGAYVLSDATNGKPDVLLIGTGSEVSLCLNAQESFKKQGVEARVISMPSWKLFEDQDEAYRESVLPSQIKARVSVELAARFGLGTVCRNQWRARRHENLWRISASAGAHKEIWLYSRGCCCRCHRAVPQCQGINMRSQVAINLLFPLFFMIVCSSSQH